MNYGLNWYGKEFALDDLKKDIDSILTPDFEHNNKDENINSENIYIKGDNLEALKHLLILYKNKIKCIYIDPPYNTQNKSFCYNDCFMYDDETLKKIGIKKTKENKRKLSHSAWLTFMLPRLTLARELLSDDGVIFISIDDNEQANLKLLCDEVFGEENFNVVFPRVTKKGGKSSDVTAKNHDFVLMYVKNKNNSDLIGISHIDSGYSNKDEFFDIRGFYKLNQTLDYDSLGYVQSLDYPIVIDDETFYAGGNKENYENRQNGQHGRADWGWRWSKELYEFGKKNGFIEIKRGGNRPRIYTKTYEKVKIENINGEYKIIEFDRTKPLSTLEFTDNKYSNDNATKVIDNLIGKGVFEYTKPPELNIQLSNLVNKKNFTILDFFSGSATTAHAVMQLNAEDGGNRKYILVNIPEPTKENTEAFKAGYKTICDIGIARIKKAAEKIKNVTNADIDYGFKIYELKRKEKMTENCNNCIWKLDGKCVNADSIYVKGHISANILCPFWDLFPEKDGVVQK